MKPILEIKDLSIDFKVRRGILRACDKVTMTIYEGDIVGIIGESGSGKSTLASGILKTVRAPGAISSGSILYHAPDGEVVDLVKLSEKGYAKYRWSNITTVFQAAQNVFNPSLKIKDHFIETANAYNRDMTKSQILERAGKLLNDVRLEERILDAYPHHLSGGMKQRVVIALSLLLKPNILILDEPTTALDVITQWYILDILWKIHEELGITMIFLTHDVSIIGSIVDRIAVMYSAQLIEYGKVLDVFTAPTHPYTYGLLRAVPSLRDDISKRRAIAGYPPNLLNLPAICRFAPRCFLANQGMCKGDLEKTDCLYDSGDEQLSRCYMHREVMELCR